MSDFNIAEANQRKEFLLDRVRKVRDLLEKDVINYYSDDYVESEEEERKQRQDIRKYLKFSYQELDKILDTLDRE